MVAVEAIANADELADLHNPELIPLFFDCVSDDYLPWGARAMSEAELNAVQKLTDALNKIVPEALRLKRHRGGGARLVGGLRFRGGNVTQVPAPDAEDLATAGWFESIQPSAREAFDTFMVRGWMSEGL